MVPKLDVIDHIHVYVSSWEKAEAWYSAIMGLTRMQSLMQWAVKGGPLMLENSEKNIHFAVFEREDHGPSSAIAFGTDGKEFLLWKKHLEGHGLELRVSDHELAYSIYFEDPDGNLYEITTYQHDYVAEHLH